MPPVVAVITAAGSGTRLGYALPKALVPIGDLAIISHALSGIVRAVPDLAQVIITAPAAQCEEFAATITREVPGPLPPLAVVAGGETRAASVAAGLRAATAITPHTVILIHDAARPFVTAPAINRVIAAVAAGAPAVVPTIPAVDTMRLAEAGTDPFAASIGAEVAAGEIPRERVRIIQTPQGFSPAAILPAHGITPPGDGGVSAPAKEPAPASGHACEFTDDAAMVAARGGQVYLVAGCSEAFKITYPADIIRAQELAVTNN